MFDIIITKYLIIIILNTVSSLSSTAMMRMLIKVLANENSYDKTPDKPIVVGGVVFPEQVYSL